jgi:hypothetical protein
MSSLKQLQHVGVYIDFFQCLIFKGYSSITERRVDKQCMAMYWQCIVW